MQSGEVCGGGEGVEVSEERGGETATGDAVRALGRGVKEGVKEEKGASSELPGSPAPAANAELRMERGVSSSSPSSGHRHPPTSLGHPSQATQPASSSKTFRLPYFGTADFDDVEEDEEDQKETNKLASDLGKVLSLREAQQQRKHQQQQKQSQSRNDKEKEKSNNVPPNQLEQATRRLKPIPLPLSIPFFLIRTSTNTKPSPPPSPLPLPLPPPPSHAPLSALPIFPASHRMGNYDDSTLPVRASPLLLLLLFVLRRILLLLLSTTPHDDIYPDSESVTPSSPKPTKNLPTPVTCPLFRNFLRTVSKHPAQVLRYEYDGVPLIIIPRR